MTTFLSPCIGAPAVKLKLTKGYFSSPDPAVCSERGFRKLWSCNKCLSLRLSRSCFHLLPLFFFNHPVLTLPIPPCLLPPLAVAFCQSAHPPSAVRGVWSKPLQVSLCPFLSYLLSACVSFQPAVLCRSSCSRTSSLHYLPSSPSSKMTFSDFAWACQFEVAAVGKGKWKRRKNNLVWGMTSQARRSWCQV